MNAAANSDLFLERRGGRSATDDDLDLRAVTVLDEPVRNSLHAVHGRGHEGAHGDQLCLVLLHGVDEVLDGHILTKVVHVQASCGQHGLDDVLTDVVNVSLYDADDADHLLVSVSLRIRDYRRFNHP